MRRVGLMAAVLAMAAMAPERAYPQVQSATVGQSASFGTTDQFFDTSSVLVTASTGWVAPVGRPGVHVGCPRPSPYAFGPNPGMYFYGWYMSPFDVRYSNFWLMPISPWYGFRLGVPGFGYGYGSWWPGYRGLAWDPTPSRFGYCGAGSSAWWHGQRFGLGGAFGYPPHSGWGYGNHWNPWYSPFASDPGGAIGINSGSGRIPESERQAKGIRVIESRPETGGADLRRIDRSRLDDWSRQLGADAADAGAQTPDARNAIADALARTRASRQASGESISEVIDRTRTRTDRPARVSEPVRKAPNPRATIKPTKAPSSTAKSAPRTAPRIVPKVAPRASPGATSRSTPKATRGVTPKRSPTSASKAGVRSSGKARP